MAIKRVEPLKTPVGTLSYPHVIEPQQFPPEPGQPPPPPNYNCVIVFTAEQEPELEPMSRSAREARDNKFGANPPRGLRSPFRKNEEAWKEVDGKLVPEPGYPAGGRHIACSSGAVKPDLRDKDMQVITDASKLYAGCKVRAVVVPYGYDRRGNKGVKFGLKVLQKVAEGPNIAGRVNAEDYFQPVADQAENAATGATTGDGWGDTPEDERF